MKITEFTDFIGITDSRKSYPVPAETSSFNRQELGPKKTELTWETTADIQNKSLPTRYKKTLMIIGFFITILLVFMKEFPLIAVVASVFFISYVISKNPPEKIKYEISNHGVDVGGRVYYWDEMARFFFSKNFGYEVLTVDLKQGFPTRLIIPFLQKDKEKIIELIKKHVQYFAEEPLTMFDKAYTSFLNKFDFENKK